MGTIYIYNGASRLSVPVTDSAERAHSLQQHNYIRLVWKSAENTLILSNAFVEYEGGVFYNIDDYYPTYNEGVYEYDIQFHSIEGTFNRPLFFRYVEVTDQSTGETITWKEIEWSLNGNLKTIADIVIDCLNRAYDNAYFALPADANYEDTLLLAYTFSSHSIADALSTIAEQNETEWWIERTGNYGNGKWEYLLHFDKCEFGDVVELNDRYTEQADGSWASGGLKSVSQSSNTNVIPQKLYVYGSERNITKKTIEEQVAGGVMNVSYDKKLRLPKVFPNTIIGANGAIYENNELGLAITLNEDSSLSIGGINNKFEQSKIFDDIYPKMDMTTTGVSVENTNGENPIYWLKADRLKSIVVENPYDNAINPGKLGLLIEGCTLMCTFTSGLLNGREFECAWRESTAEIGLIPIDENDVQIPNGAYKPNEGDTFILWNLAMPQSSIEIAQNELCVEAIKHIEGLVATITDTNCVSEAEAFRVGGYNQQIKVGQRVSVDSNVFRNGRLLSRIINFSYKLTKPYDISFTLASARQTGRIRSLENKIADVTKEVHSTGQVQRAISRRQWHDTMEMMQMLDSIQKQMVVVGDENSAFVTSCQVKYNNETKLLTISKGYVEHQSYKPNNGDGAWSVNSLQISLASYSKDTPYYVFFACLKNNSIADIGIDIALPEESDYYFFTLGILSSEYEGVRVFNQTSGLTTLAGGTITTEVTQDAARQLIIDFTNKRIIARNGAEIIGNIKFLSANGKTLDFANAFEQSTAIDGGLVLTNDIEIKDNNGNSTTGLSGSNDSLRIWAGDTKENADNAPFRVYANGETYATRLYGFSPAFEINVDNFNLYAPYGTISLDEVGSKILLNLTKNNMVMTLADGTKTTQFISLPINEKYIGADVEIYNPNGLAINLCSFIPECSIEDFYKQDAPNVSTHYYYQGYNWAYIKNTCSESDNKTYKYIKLRCMATPLLIITNGDIAVSAFPKHTVGLYTQFYFWVIEKYIE